MHNLISSHRKGRVIREGEGVTPSTSYHANNQHCEKYLRLCTKISGGFKDRALLTPRARKCQIYNNDDRGQGSNRILGITNALFDRKKLFIWFDILLFPKFKFLLLCIQV